MIRPEDINSLESESGVIASLIFHPEFCFYSENLLPTHFTNKDNKCIYIAICDLAQKGITQIDPYNIIEDLNSSETTRKYSEGLTVEKLHDFIDVADILARHTVEEYKLLVSNVLDAAFRRNAFIRLKECMNLCTKRDEEDVAKKISESIDDIMMEYQSSTDDIEEFGEIVDDLWEEIKNHNDGIPFKFPTLNEYVTIDKGELVVVAAPPKKGKSMFMLNEAVDILKQGKSVFYLDSELPDKLFLCRLVSHLTGIDFNRIKCGRYTQDEDVRIKKSLRWIKEQKFIHLYMPIFNKQSIYMATKKIHHKFDGLDVIIVDYLKPTGSSTDAYAVYSELGILTDLLKNEICGDMGIAGLAAAQLGENSRLADSKKITMFASTVIHMTDKTENDMIEDGEGSGNRKIMVTQNRNGMQHVGNEWINLDFNGNICNITESKVQHIPYSPF